MLTIEERAQLHDTRAFVTAETVDVLAAKFVSLIGDRRITKMHRYLGDNAGTPTVYAGLRPDHRGYGPPVNHTVGHGVGVHLASRARGLEGVGFGIGRDPGETEAQMGERYHDATDGSDFRRRDITRVELMGWPGSPARDDSIRIEYWNEHGVGQESILVFDDFDMIDELFWDITGDKDRHVCMWDAFCDDHGMHFENPAHERTGCKGREATLAENLDVLALLAVKPCADVDCVSSGRGWLCETHIGQMSHGETEVVTKIELTESQREEASVIAQALTPAQQSILRRMPKLEGAFRSGYVPPRHGTGMTRRTGMALERRALVRHQTLPFEGFKLTELGRAVAEVLAS